MFVPFCKVVNMRTFMVDHKFLSFSSIHSNITIILPSIQQT